MRRTLYAETPNAKHTYRIDLKVTEIQTVIVRANSMAEAKHKAMRAMEIAAPTAYDWATFGHCTKETAK